MPQRKRGKVPRYWWDFNWDDDKILNILIRTNDPSVGSGIVRIVHYGRGAILRAETLVKDLQEGRVKV